MATIKNRLDLLEKRLSPRPLIGLNLGLTASTLEELREIAERCHKHNADHADGMIWLFACYIGEPCEESEALLASCRPQEGA
jgi:hypothetical protein